jgi:hypothetical protein
MITNFNKQPYFDDFDEKKNFVRVLFKPSRPVQVRELNQIQSIQHNHIERLAEHIFKHGARVNGNEPTRLNVHYVTIQPNSPWDNGPVNLNRLIGKRLRGQTSGVEALLLKSLPAEDNDPITLFVSYTKTGTDKQTLKFQDNETIDVVDNNDTVTYSCKVRCPTCTGSNDPRPDLNPTGRAVIWSIPESIYYVWGYFIEVQPELIVAEKYTNNTSSYVVGFDVISDIVTAEDDPSLYDNALGYPNFSAEGADRARIRLVPAIRSVNFDDGENFITLARVVNGVIQYVRSRTDYSKIMDMLAERTFDESGNYTVVPFKVKLFEHLKKYPNDPNGYFTQSQGGDENKFVAIVSSGKAYIRGYQVEKIAESLVVLEKARDTKKVDDFYNRLGGLNYVLVKLENNSGFAPGGASGSGIFNNGTVNLYDGPFSSGVPTGNIIGKMKVYDVEYDSTVSGVDHYRLYFTQIEMNASKTYDMVKSIYNAGFVNFAATTINDDATSKPKIYDSSFNVLIWETGKTHVKSLHDVNNSTASSLSVTIRKKFSAALNASGQYTWNAGSGEFFDVVDQQYTLVGVVESTGAFTKLPLSSVTVTPTSITVNAGASNSGKTVILFHNVMRNGVVEKTKTLVDTVDTDLQLSGNSFVLSKADLFKITSIKSYDTSNPSVKTDATEHFTWTNGQSDYAYIPIVVTKKSTAPSWPATTRFEVSYTYYSHSAGDYFSVDSYSNIVNSPSVDYGYEDIPVYKSTTGIEYDLRNCLDFRPLILDANPISINQPALNSIFRTDIEYYLPRIDSIVVNMNGEIYQKKGVSSETPQPPHIESDGELEIYQIIMKPFVYNISTDIIAKFIENKRYTMHDIGLLERRINNIEYYTTFTLLEKQLADMTVKDVNGHDRFKNGFVADNFINYQAADLTSGEFRAALDRKNTELRPPYTMKSVGFDIDTSSTTNAKILGKVAMIDYDSEFWHAQPYASKNISINPYFVYETKGEMILLPDHDSWGNVDRQPNVTFNIDVGVQNLENSGLLGTEWGAWSLINSTVIGRSFPTRGQNDVVEITTFRNTFQRSGILTTYDTRTDSYSLGDRVSDVNLIPYMRSREIEFHATGMKPNTRLYAFFDGVNVTADCRPLTTGSRFGDELVVDSHGNISGIFRIPEGRFFNGQKTFRLTNAANDSRDPDSLLTSAEAVYWAGGLNISKQNETLNVITPVLSRRTVTERQTRIESTTTVMHFSTGVDPIAQTFFANESCFVTELDLWFYSVFESDNIFVQIKNTENGYPGSEILGEAFLSWNQINTDKRGITPTRVKFPFPVFLEGGKEYAIVVGGNSPETRIWISALGQEDVTQPGLIIDKQPSLGSLFKSQNNSTWTASQNEDLKYTIYRARFKHNNMTLALKNKPFVDDTVVFDPFETEAGSRRVRVHAKNHGMTVGDKTEFRIGELSWLNVTESSGKLVAGQVIITSTGSAKIKEVKSASGGTVDCLLTEIKGYFTTGQSFTAASITPALYDSYIVSNFTSITSFNPSNNVTGFVNQNINISVNGIPQSELNGELTVIEVDSVDSFIVETDTPATSSGFAGGNVVLNVNQRFEMFNVSGSFTANDTDYSWMLYGTGHKCNGLFESQNYVRLDPKQFSSGSDTFLKQPYKLANRLNEIRNLASDSSIKITGNFETNNTLISPIVNVDTFSIICVANRIGFINQTTYAVSPNASTRFIPETDPMQGVETYKYVTRNISLQNPALDLKILVDVYKPQDADFDMYVKILHPWENVDIDTKSWILVPDVWKNFISTNLLDYREIEVDLSESLPSVFGSNEFSVFKVKLVGRSKNPANPTMFKRFRVLALT